MRRVAPICSASTRPTGGSLPWNWRPDCRGCVCSPLPPRPATAGRSFYFGSATDSVRFRHIRRTPHVSATHLPGEEFAVTVHGRAVPIDVRSPTSRGFRQTLIEVYTPRYGDAWESFLDSGPVYARIEARRMFAFAMNESGPSRTDGG
jgi:hypothetical protein